MFRSSLVLTNINNGALSGIKAMPQKDSTSDNTSTFSMGRHAFVNTYSTDVLTNAKKWIGGNRDASQVTTNNRNNRIGTGSVNANGDLMAFTTYSEKINNYVTDKALQRVRSGGAVSPVKKAFSPSQTYVPTPTYRPMTQNMKSLYGNKMPTIYH